MCPQAVGVALGRSGSVDELDGKGALVFPAFVDAHTHLVKTNTAPRCRNTTGSINEALVREVEDKERWMVRYLNQKPYSLFPNPKP